MAAGARAAEWLSRLVRIPSVSPAQAGPRSGTPGEALLGKQVASWFREFGGEVHVHEAAPGRSNVYGIWRGGSEGWAAVDVHMDTVGVEQMTVEPFSGDIRDERVHGRGAVDTKATLGVVLALLEEMSSSGAQSLPGIIVAATVDEEDGALGAPAFAQWLRERELVLDQLAVAEPTQCGPVVGHKGVLRMELRIAGRPAHSAQPRLGKNAITAAARLILALDEEDQRLGTSGTPAAPTLTVTRVRGGTGLNVVPDSCTLGIDRRLVGGEDGDRVATHLIELAQDHCPLPFTSSLIKKITAFSQDPEAPWVRQLAGWSGRAPAVVPYCTNAWAYRGVARDCVVIGPGSIDQAHGVEEWVEVSELEKLASIYARWWGIGTG